MKLFELLCMCWRLTVYGVLYREYAAGLRGLIKTDYILIC